MSAHPWYGVSRQVLRVTRTIADLAECDAIELPHVAEALQLKRALEDEMLN